jgi:Rrf2 family protein
MLSQTCEYALRAATYIAQHGQDGPVLAKDIAADTGVPHQYLQKVLRELVRGRILSSARGIGGGFRLRKPPEKVYLVDLIDRFEDILAQTECPFGNPECGHRNPCPVHDQWRKVVDSYKSFLETTTLADLVAKKSRRRKRGGASGRSKGAR